MQSKWGAGKPRSQQHFRAISQDDAIWSLRANIRNDLPPKVNETVAIAANKIIFHFTNVIKQNAENVEV